VSADDVIGFGGGALVVGQQAVDAGLCDKLGTFESVIADLIGQAETPDPTGIFSGAAAGTIGQADDLSQEVNMTLIDRIRSAMGAAAEVEIPESHAAAPPPVAPETNEWQERALAAERLAMEAHAQVAQAQAAAFLAGAADRITPAERPGLTEQYLLAAEDDVRAPLPGRSRVDRLQESIQARPPHGLLRQQMPDNARVSLLGPKHSDRDGNDLSDANVDKMLAMTPEGQAVLARRHANERGK
jgi:hypothetical protein